jgi:hypothetical protein
MNKRNLNYKFYAAGGSVLPTPEGGSIIITPAGLKLKTPRKKGYTYDPTAVGEEEDAQNELEHYTCLPGENIEGDEEALYIPEKFWKEGGSSRSLGKGLGSIFMLASGLIIGGGPTPNRFFREDFEEFNEEWLWELLD